MGEGYGSVKELTEVPGIVARAYRTHTSSGRVHKMLYPYPGYCGTGRTELAVVPGRYKNAVPLPWVLWHGRTDLAEVPGTGRTELTEVLCAVWMLYRTHRSSGYG